MTTLNTPLHIQSYAPEEVVSTQQPATIDSKEAVLDAAQRLISQYGYTGFSMRDLAQECGLAKATLYHHFQDKREILLQVLHRDIEITCSRIAIAAATPGDLSARLRNVADAFVALATERGMLLLSALRQAAGMEEEFCLLLRTYQDELQRPVVQLLRDAMAEGVVRRVDPEIAAMSFLGLLQVLTSQHLLMKYPPLDESAVDAVIDLTLHGLLPSSSNEHP